MNILYFSRARERKRERRKNRLVPRKHIIDTRPRAKKASGDSIFYSLKFSAYLFIHCVVACSSFCKCERVYVRACVCVQKFCRSTLFQILSERRRRRKNTTKKRRHTEELFYFLCNNFTFSLTHAACHTSNNILFVSPAVTVVVFLFSVDNNAQLYFSVCVSNWYTDFTLPQSRAEHSRAEQRASNQAIKRNRNRKKNIIRTQCLSFKFLFTFSCFDKKRNNTHSE